MSIQETHGLPSENPPLITTSGEPADFDKEITQIVSPILSEPQPTERGFTKQNISYASASLTHLIQKISETVSKIFEISTKKADKIAALIEASQPEYAIGKAKKYHFYQYQALLINAEKGNTQEVLNLVNKMDVKKAASFINFLHKMHKSNPEKHPIAQELIQCIPHALVAGGNDKIAGKLFKSNQVVNLARLCKSTDVKIQVLLEFTKAGVIAPVLDYLEKTNPKILEKFIVELNTIPDKDPQIAQINILRLGLKNKLSEQGRHLESFSLKVVLQANEFASPKGLSQEAHIEEEFTQVVKDLSRNFTLQFDKTIIDTAKSHPELQHDENKIREATLIELKQFRSSHPNIPFEKFASFMHQGSFQPILKKLLIPNGEYANELKESDLEDPLLNKSVTMSFIEDENKWKLKIETDLKVKLGPKDDPMADRTPLGIFHFTLEINEKQEIAVVTRFIKHFKNSYELE